MKKPRRLQKSDTCWLLAAAALVLLQFWWLPGDPGTPDDSYSNAIEGKRGLFETLHDLSTAGVLPPVRRETARLIPDGNATLLVLSPDRYPNTHEQSELATWVYNGGTLLFAPNWSNPDCSVFQLSISIQAQPYFQQQATVSPTAAPGSSGTTPAESPATTGDAVESGNTAAPETPIPAEAPESGTSPEPPASDGTPAVDASAAQSAAAPPGTATAEDDEDDIDLNKTPSLLPKQGTEAIIENADESSVRVSEIESSSTLVQGSVPWRTRASMTTPPSRATTLVQGPSGEVQAASWKYGNGLVVVSASPDVFSNRAMLDETQAELAVRLVEYAHADHAGNNRGGATIVVSEFLNSTDSYRGTAVLMSPGLRSGTLQLILIAMLAGWYGFHRFGPPVKTQNLRRRSLTDSAIAVGNLQFRSTGSAESVRCYTEYLKSVLRRLFGGTVRLEDFTAVAHRTGLSPEEVQQRVNTAEDLGANRHTNPARAAAAIRGLADLHARLTGSKDVASKPARQKSPPA